MKFKDTDIYPVITPAFCGGRDPLFVLEATLKGGAKVVQLREKIEPEKYAADFRQLTTQYGALFIVNDSIEIALKYKADGVHIGQEDIALAAARKLAPDLIIGVSVNSLEEAKIAQKEGADYITAGVAFPTKTKTDVKSVTGLDLIREIVAAELALPLVTIGGINCDNIDQILALGIKHIAMATAITQAEDVEAATHYFVGRINP